MCPTSRGNVESRQLAHGGALDSQTSDSQHIRVLVAEESARAETESLNRDGADDEDDEPVVCGKDVPDESGIANCCDCCSELKLAHQNLKIIRELNHYQRDELNRLQNIIDVLRLDPEQQSQAVREPSPVVHRDGVSVGEGCGGTTSHGYGSGRSDVKVEQGRKRARREGSY
ncbi:uncharacterized protein B0H18DRAFT_956977 [Fomitopsis serialis]|uniref:uncharacterized protein n=1 Tax=Fomitopsis serialis TaxID=139415 RepID=UPI002007AA40|nr:uncharacterized protein B0H18DRAFT_956977 [Neoantrodia serialis]KAH9920587.1 hypothetical protein B0H18DRAFT_956977 [Neoantrodia serialis]